MLSNKTFAVRGSTVHGTKEVSSKLRITVLFACSMLGEKLRPLVIGKSENPRCFNNKNRSRFPVSYRHNDSCWMTEKYFNEWLSQLNTTMPRQNRKILVFIDNAPVHGIKSDLSNVEVVFYPANCTSVLQPLDQGIIRSFKVYFRALLLRRMTFDLERHNPPELNLYDAISWIGIAWDKITTNVIQNCFVKAGYGSRDAIEVAEEMARLEIEQEREIQDLLNQLPAEQSTFLNTAALVDFD